MTVSRFFATASLALALAPALQAQTVSNSRFDQGLSGWTVSLSSPDAVGAPGSVEAFDFDGSGPLAPSPAAAFQTGKQPGTPGANHFGVFLEQVVELQAGITYDFRIDWATSNASDASANGGRYRLLLAGEVNETVNVGVVPAGGTVSGVLEQSFTADASGPATLRVLVDTVAEVGTPPFITQRVDNVRLEHGLNSFPGFLSVLGGGVETFELDAGPARAGDLYLLLGSATGEVPGIDLANDVHLPLVLDPYTTFPLTGGSVFVNAAGILDGQGRATASLVLPGGLNPALAGQTLHHAWLGLSTTGASTFGSNADSVLLF